MDAVKPVAVWRGVGKSRDEALAQAVRESGCSRAGVSNAMSASGIVEALRMYPEIFVESLLSGEAALNDAVGAANAGARYFCALAHDELGGGSDVLMAATINGTVGGLVVVVTDALGRAPSGNDEDSRHWSRLMHLPLLEPADSRETYELTQRAFELSEEFACPVILRLTAHGASPNAAAQCVEGVPLEGKDNAVNVLHDGLNGAANDVTCWAGLSPAATRRLPMVLARDRELAFSTSGCDLNKLIRGQHRRVGFITAGPDYLHVRAAFPDSPIVKMGLSYPLPMKLIRGISEMCETLIVVESGGALVETELRAEGIKLHGKDVLPGNVELQPDALKSAIAELLSE